MLKSVIKYLFNNIGSACSSKKTADSMTSAGRKISNHTVESYIEGLTGSLLMYRVGRYDIKGKEHLKLIDTYDAADVGLRYYLLGTNNADNVHILENVVYLEIIRRGYEVNVGKNGNTEVDFTAVNFDGNIEYYQVSWTVREEKTILLTMDNDLPVLYNGIRQKYVLDWLLDK